MKKLQETTFTKYMKIGAVIVAIVVIIMEIRSCNKDKTTATEKTTTEITPEESISRERAFYASKLYVRNALVKADSIVFPVYGAQVTVTPSAGNLYTVATWADEINTSGINVRHEYKAEMKMLNERDWSCRSLILDGEIIK